MKRTGELQRSIPNISQKMLIQQLRELEQDDIVRRHVYREVPPRVEYTISPYGESLGQVLDLLCGWGESHVAKLQAEGKPVSLHCSGDVEVK